MRTPISTSYGWRHATVPVTLAAFALLAACGSSTVTLRQMVGKAEYWPPRCEADPCVLTGMGGIQHIWERHVDEQLALGRSFVVTGVCASACEIAARRAHARVLLTLDPGDFRRVAPDLARRIREP